MTGKIIKIFIQKIEIQTHGKVYKNKLLLFAAKCQIRKEIMDSTRLKQTIKYPEIASWPCMLDLLAGKKKIGTLLK